MPPLSHDTLSRLWGVRGSIVGKLVSFGSRMISRFGSICTGPSTGCDRSSGAASGVYSVPLGGVIRSLHRGSGVVRAPLVEPVKASLSITKTRGNPMSRIPAFHSINEGKKPAANRVHHDNSLCPPGRDIPENERRSGSGGYRLCEDCKNLNDQGR